MFLYSAMLLLLMPNLKSINVAKKNKENKNIFIDYYEILTIQLGRVINCKT